MNRRFWPGLLAGLVGLGLLLAACDTAEPTLRPTHTKLPSLVPSATINPALPDYDPYQGQGLNDPTAAAAASGMSLDLPPAPGDEPFEVIASADGLRLRGMLYRADNAPAPGLLLLHGAGGSREDWAALITPLQQAGYNVLALDQRGHGATGGALNWNLAAGDALDALSALGGTEGVDALRLGVVGAEIGGSLGLDACVAMPTCGAAVLLSPSLDVQGVRVEGALGHLETRTVLLVASQEDTASSAAGQAIEGQAGGQAELRLLAGGGFGTSLFRFDPTLAEALLRWLGGNL